jgi:hypothetical protein
VTDCCANGERNVNFKRSRTENDVHQVSDTLDNLQEVTLNDKNEACLANLKLDRTSKL